MLNCKKEIDADSRFIIYSAAGKAVNFAFVLSHLKNEELLRCVDVSSYKSGKFMEASGARVLAIDELESQIRKIDVLFILNPSHEAFATSKFPIASLERVYEI
jgi:hypothetical protein